MICKNMRKSVDYLAVSTLLIIAFFKGPVCDWLLIANGSIWIIAVTIILVRHFEKSAEIPEDEISGDDSQEELQEELPESPQDDPAKEAENWYLFSGQEAIEAMVTELNVHGIKSLSITEDGTVTHDNIGIDLPDGFPAKAAWGALIPLLAEDGLDATIEDDCFVISW